MRQLLRFPGAVKREAAIDLWMRQHPGELGEIAQRWFEVMRGCGGDVRELLHDGHPTACVGDAAFGYVNAFKAHVNVGFFRGSELFDPQGLLEGTGKFMRHVKLRPVDDVDATALTKLIHTAYIDMQRRLKDESCMQAGDPDRRQSTSTIPGMKKTNSSVALSPGQGEELLEALKARFEENMNRHKGLQWAKVQARLEANPGKLWSLNEMERTEGEPDVVGQDKKKGEYVFCDCSAESPKGRRSLCYDAEALASRKEHKPRTSALEMAAAMGIELLTEEEYRELQKLGEFDAKTSSWVKTPADIRVLGGALFCDRRFGHVFLYHNGAESYYAVRGFRGSLRV